MGVLPLQNHTALAQVKQGPLLELALTTISSVQEEHDTVDPVSVGRVIAEVASAEHLAILA